MNTIKLSLSLIAFTLSLIFADEAQADCDVEKYGYFCKFYDVCGKAPLNLGYIMHGRDVALGEFPSYVYVDDSQYMCGGVILSDYHILTAANCTSTNRVHVWTDTRIDTRQGGDWTNPNEWKNVSKICHDRRTTYKGKPELAILRLEKPLNFSTPFVRPACLAETNPREIITEHGSICLQIGVGASEIRNLWGTRVPKFRVQKIRVVERDCDEEDGQKLAGGGICVSAHPYRPLGSVCKSDEGGPVLCYDKDSLRWTLAGVAVNRKNLELADQNECEEGASWVIRAPKQNTIYLAEAAEECGVE